MPVNYPMITEIAKKTYLINEFGFNSMYLIVGNKRALLVDTGAGLCDLKSLIRRLTPLPFDVVITHAHVGHIGGAKQFSAIWIHPDEIENALSVGITERKQYVSQIRNSGNENVWAFENDLLHWDKAPENTELFDGLQFDLGGRCVRTLYTPGHTIGSCSFIDDQSRILFSGCTCSDQLEINTFVSTMVRGLFNLHRHTNEFDQIFSGHIARESILKTQSISKKVLLENIMACRLILENIMECSDYDAERNDLNRKLKVGTSIVLFNSDRLWEPGENKAPIPIGM